MNGDISSGNGGIDTGRAETAAITGRGIVLNHDLVHRHRTTPGQVEPGSIVIAGVRQDVVIDLAVLQSDLRVIEGIEPSTDIETGVSGDLDAVEIHSRHSASNKSSSGSIG